MANPKDVMVLVVACAILLGIHCNFLLCFLCQGLGMGQYSIFLLKGTTQLDNTGIVRNNVKQKYLKDDSLYRLATHKILACTVTALSYICTIVQFVSGRFTYVVVHIVSHL